MPWTPFGTSTREHMGHRLLRINESIRETLSSVIAAEGLKDPRVGFVTVTGVVTSADLRHAKVYVSVLGKAAERERTMAALDSSRGFLQARLNAELHTEAHAATAVLLRRHAGQRPAHRKAHAP